jgi:hypothetical protein
MCKGTKIFSEVASFFKKSGNTSAIGAISHALKFVKFNYLPMGFAKPKPNCLYPAICILQLLLMFPCFSVVNPSHYTGSPLFKLVSCHKDVFYDFLNNGQTKWRKIMYYINCQLWKKITVRADHKKRSLPTVLIFDDTDIIKANSGIEMVSKIFSHVTNSSHWGFKGLFCCLSDGISHMLMDFALCREYKDAEYGLSRKQAERQYKSADGGDAEVASRKAECDMSKIELMKEMIRRCIKNGLQFGYVLCDSWFACKDIIDFVRGLHGKHYLGMTKMSKTRYGLGQELLTANTIASRMWKKERKHRRLFGYSYMIADVTLGEKPVRLFFSRRNNKEKWRAYITTDMSMDFEKAFRVYSMRWAIEVCNKEEKGLLKMDKCQSRHFAAQIAHVSVTCLQYNILSLAKRFSDYETIGELFRGTMADAQEVVFAERIMEFFIEIAAELEEICGCDTEKLIDCLINKPEKSDSFVKICERLAS